VFRLTYLLTLIKLRLITRRQVPAVH